MRKKLFWVSLCALSITLLLAGCGNGQQSAGSNESGTISSASGTQLSTDDSKPDGTASGEAEQPSAPSSDQISSAQESENTAGSEENAAMKMNVQVGNHTFTATLEKNKAANTLVEMMEKAPVTIQMNDYGGFEKVGPLGTSLPTSNSQTTTHAGDIVLYQSNQIVIFYGSNSWSYTRLGKIDDLTGWEEALGSGNVTVTFSLGA